MENKSNGQNPEISGNKQEARDEKGRFIEGVSGNPAGKPKGIKNYTTEMKEAIVEYARINGKSPEEVERLINMKAIAEMLKGNFSFYKDDKDRKFGQASQTHKVDGSIEAKIVYLPQKNK